MHVEGSIDEGMEGKESEIYNLRGAFYRLLSEQNVTDHLHHVIGSYTYNKHSN